MEAIDKIKIFLSETKDVSLGFNEINFVKAENFDKEQTGYGIDQNGKSLITSNAGDWHEGWFVIATDDLGDPMVVDANTGELTILSLEHGEDGWEPIIIADSLEGFKKIIRLLTDISKNRTNPVALENNPISENDLINALKRIEEQNPNCEMCFWDIFFETD